MVLYNRGYPPKTHVRLKSREITIAHNEFLMCPFLICPIVLKLRTSHDNITALCLCKILKRLDNCDGCYRWRNFATFEFNMTVQWRHNERDCVSSNRGFGCSLNRLSRRRSKKTSKLRVTSLCEGNPSVTGGFPTQKARNAEIVSIWWRHHEFRMDILYCTTSIYHMTSVINLQPQRTLHSFSDVTYTCHCVSNDWKHGCLFKSLFSQ